MGCFSKYGLLTINFFVVTFGLCVIGVSADILHLNTIYGLLISNQFSSKPQINLLAGIFLTYVGILGCLGAIKEHPVLLKIYAVVTLVLLILTMASGISILVFTANMSSFLEGGMTIVFNKYGDEDMGNLTHGLDVFQHTKHCCGIVSYTDWGNFTYGNKTNVADGCCRNQTLGCGEGLLDDPNVEELVYTTGCLSFVVNVFYPICLALEILTFALASFQLLGIVWARIIAKDWGRYEQI